jgi:hypothetical protein
MSWITGCFRSHPAFAKQLESNHAQDEKVEKGDKVEPDWFIACYQECPGIKTFFH